MNKAKRKALYMELAGLLSDGELWDVRAGCPVTHTTVESLVAASLLERLRPMLPSTDEAMLDLPCDEEGNQACPACHLEALRGAGMRMLSEDDLPPASQRS